MNENAIRLHLGNFLDGTDAWGRDTGRVVFRKLEDELVKIEPITKVIVIDFSGLTRCDASFPQEAIVELVRKFRGIKYFLLTNFENMTVEENVSLAFEKRNEVGIVRDSRGFRTIGFPLTEDFIDILKVAEIQDHVTSNLVQKRFDLSIQNASNKLNLLWKMGLLQKIEASAKSGGRENIYTRVG
jgi:hypothetical protein